MPAPTISGEERDLLYRMILDRIDGIDSIRVAIEERRWSIAQELASEFSDLFRFVCSDLGWGARPFETISVRTAPPVLRGAAIAIRTTALADRATCEREGNAHGELAGEACQIENICDRIIRETAIGRDDGALMCPCRRTRASHR
jgi:hypothetical protein